MKTVEELLSRAICRTEYDNGHVHECYEFSREELEELIAAARREEPVCNPHPKAPHGFDRNASHNEGEYVCDCRGWDPYQAGYDAGFVEGLNYGDRQEE